MSGRRQAPAPIDPTDWANKQKAAKEHAKRLREERIAASTGGSTFTPQVNKRPDYLGDKPSKSPSSMQLQSAAPSHPALEVFEQPLPGRANKNIYEDTSRDTQHIATKAPAKRNPQPLANYASSGSPGNSHGNAAAGGSRQRQQYDDYDDYGGGGARGGNGNARGRPQRNDGYDDDYGRGGAPQRAPQQQQQPAGGRRQGGRYRDEDQDDGYGGGGGGRNPPAPNPSDVFEQPLPGRANKNIYEDTSRDNQHIAGGSNPNSSSRVGGGGGGGGRRRDEYEQYDEPPRQSQGQSGYRSQFTQEQVQSSKPQGHGSRRQAQRQREQGWNEDTGYEYEDEGHGRGGGNSHGGRNGGYADNGDSYQDDRRAPPQQQQQAKPPRRRPQAEKPGWNDDFVEGSGGGGFGDPAPVGTGRQGVQLSSRPPFQNNVERDDFMENMDKNYDQRQKSNPNKAALGRGSRRAAAGGGGGGWNTNTDINYDEPPRVSPRLPAQQQQSHGHGHGVPQGHPGDGSGQPARARADSQPSAPPMSVSASADVTKARSGLSQLKARIRGSRGASSDNNVASRTLDFSNSGVGSEVHSQRTSSAPNEYAVQMQAPHGNQQGQSQRGDYRSSGTAPKHVTPRKDMYQQQQEDDHNYVPNNDTQARRRGVVSQQQRPPQQHDPYDDMDTPPKPARSSGGAQDRYNDDRGQQQQQRRQEEQALQADDALPDDAYGDPNIPQVQCPDCGRKFNESAFERHAKICKKVFIEKRRKFDMAKKRVEGDPELAKALKKAKEEERRKAKQDAMKKGRGGGNDEQVLGEKIPKWKADRDQFRAALKAGKEYAKAEKDGTPLPPVVASAPDPSLIPCPHCGRRFNDKAAERHIPKCQDIKSQPKSLKRGSGMGIGTKTQAPTGLKPLPKRR